MADIYVYILVSGGSMFICILMYIIWNLYNKNKTYEQWILQTRDDVDTLNETVTELDSQQIFEKDDEVGAVFTGIKELIQSFKKKVKDGT
jgi:hypothetical protein